MKSHLNPRMTCGPFSYAEQCILAAFDFVDVVVGANVQLGFSHLSPI